MAENRQNFSQSSIKRVNLKDEVVSMNKIFCGNALDILKEIPSESVNMCVTSPPYYGLRDYGIKGQIGNELSPCEYIQNLVNIFEEVKRVLKHDGTLWVNIADSYAGSGRGGWDKESIISNTKSLYPQYNPSCCKMPKLWRGIKPKDMIGVPWLLAFSLREKGWYLRSDIIWHKKNGMPESVKDRPTKNYEHLFLLAKSPKYYYDYKSIQEPIANSTKARYKRGVGENKYAHMNKDLNYQKIFQPRTHTDLGEMRNKRDVWSVSTNAVKIPGHFAIYPEKLIEPCIIAGAPIGGVVLDPFFGSGTTGVVAIKNSRQYIGIELNPEYCRIAQERIDKEALKIGNSH
jgi:DNA modification methylase